MTNTFSTIAPSGPNHKKNGFNATEREPLRAAYFGLEYLEQYAKELGAESPVSANVRIAPLLQRVRFNAKRLALAHQRIQNRESGSEALTPDAEWLLDNYYIILEVLRDISQHLPRRYLSELPRLAGGPLQGYPRIYALALGLIAHTDSSLEEARITHFVHAYQTSVQLTIGEVWAVPTMLRLGLIENLARLADQIVRTRADRKRAAAWVCKPLRPGTAPHLPAGEGAVTDPFIVGMLHALRDQGPNSAAWIEVLENWLRQRETSTTDVFRREHQRQAADQVSIGNCITSLRLLAAIEWQLFFEKVSLVEAALREEPTKKYEKQDFATRDEYRRAVEQLARGAGLSELEVASRAVQLVAHATDPLLGHIGYHLIDAGRPAFEKSLNYRPGPGAWLLRFTRTHPFSIYFATSAFIFVALFLPLLQIAGVSIATSTAMVLFLVALLPFSELALALANFLVTHTLAPRVLPKLDFKETIPTDCATFVVIPSLLHSLANAHHLLERLELHFLANPDSHLYFALLTDFPDAATETTPEDEPALEAALDGIRELNRRHAHHGPDRFFLIHRRREWNESEQCWMGWERKRGKLLQFNRLMRGSRASSIEIISGDLKALPTIRFVLTLDADTQLPLDAAKKLIGTLAHPLNRPQVDVCQRRVTRGYGILQPRVSFFLQTGLRSRFAGIFAHSAGVDPYSVAVSDVYQDLFGEGSFTGKGLYDIDAVEAVLGRAFPDNHILSHDLIEGNFARCGLTSDVEVFDDFPAKYHSYARRAHRWARGDWQLLPWLAPKVPTVGAAEHTVATEPNTLTLLGRFKVFDNLRRTLVAPALIILLILGWTVLPGPPLLWTGVAVLVTAVPVLLQLLGVLLDLLKLQSPQSTLLQAGTDLPATLGQTAIDLVFLPDRACLMLHACLITLYRLIVTRRHLLEWETSAVVESRSRNKWDHFLKDMGQGCVLAIVAGILVLLVNPANLPIVLPFIVAWLAAPLLAWWISQPRARNTLPLAEGDRQYLDSIARKIWAFFEKYVGVEDNWLPPDNFQEEPKPRVAHRTSPTNIGLYLLSTLSAHDLGVLKIEDMIARIANAFATLDKLTRHRGHFLNWYDTTTLQPLLPTYISTVDSGNLLGCLLTLKQGLLEKSLDVTRDDPHSTAVLSDSDAVDDKDSLAASLLNGSADHDASSKTESASLAKQLQKLAQEADTLARAMDFRFLYNVDRNLFAIGYNVAQSRLDVSHYDLLASEASLTSFLTIARGDVPQRHWLQLGRPPARVVGRAGLLSWGGTMFEYLMPRLLWPSFDGTLLDVGQEVAVAQQIAYGRKHRVPWGISESAFNQLDAQGTYQYQSFGVPGLGLKRGLASDLVIAPYASLLALMIDAPAALSNLKRIEGLGGEGALGFYEAIDFTPSRLAAGESAHIVKSYMAHHQGMSLLAIVNCLHGNLVSRRLQAEPMVRAAELLLQERMPVNLGGADQFEEEEIREPARAAETIPVSRRLTTADTVNPRVHLLSNGPYSVMITNAGGGYSTFRGLDVTRWREDRTLDPWGQFLYLRDLHDRSVWSIGIHPTRVQPDRYEVVFSTDKAEFRRLDHGIDAHLEIAVSPERNVEVRRLTLTNTTLRPRFIEATSYAEIVLGSRQGDLSHPAFGKLFLETEWLPNYSALLCRRRPRSSDEKPIWAVHVLASEGSPFGLMRYETDRARFLGRGNSPHNPVALAADSGHLSGATGPVLDPIFSLREQIRLSPNSSTTLAFSTAVAESREEALALADQFHTLTAVTRAFELAWAHTRLQTQHLNMEPSDPPLFQRLAGHLLFASAALRAETAILKRNRFPLNQLWRLGISGDHPIVVACLTDANQMALVRRLLAAQEYWRVKGFTADLVLLNERPASYFTDLQDALQNAVASSEASNRLDKPGGVFIRKCAELAEADRILLLSTARVVLFGDRGSLSDQIDILDRQPPLPPALKVAKAKASLAKKPATAPIPLRLPDDLLFNNGIGGFSPDGARYQMLVPASGAEPPAPWCNVVANPVCGFIISEAGGGYTWVGNSQSNRLTPWTNDPVSDPCSEAFYLRDETSGVVWSPTPRPAVGKTATLVTHGQGYTSFVRREEGILSELILFVPTNDPVKIYLLNVRNESAEARSLSATFFLEWVLGTARELTAMHVQSEVDEHNTILARNYFNDDYGSAVAFVDINQRVRSMTGDRTEFLGRNGRKAAPAALVRTRLAGTFGLGLDPCAAIMTPFSLRPNEAKDIVIVLGQVASEAEVQPLLHRYLQADQARAALAATRSRWDKILNTIQVETPNAAFDVLVNRWLLYQVLSCRVWGRSAFYQSGGAYGFRDQLQDVMALVYAAPEEARAQIVRAAGRQFPEGDVQHWWHMPSGRGVRTRFRDDFLWLPYVVSHYVITTGDWSVLDESTAFLNFPPLKPDEQENYGLPTESSKKATVYEHCMLALEHGWRLGEHGLPLMGGGDWNDGMNRVGSQGKGESVWLAWFQAATLEQFANIVDRKSDARRAAEYRERARQLVQAVEKTAWDGEWYKRAFFDDGTPLGSSKNVECQIDSLPQSWAVMQGGGDRARAAQAMHSALGRLIPREHNLILLFDPPFDQGDLHPGYIKGYVPGIRENGGQYTHAAVWVVQAMAMLGDGTTALQLFDMLNPINHATAEGLPLYRVEPFVVAADVYGRAPHEGRGGWTWYTGSAAWLYRVAVEQMLGFQRNGNQLTVKPSLPRDWKEFKIVYRFEQTVYEIIMKRIDEPGPLISTVWLDGSQVGNALKLENDKRTHQVQVQFRESHATEPVSANS